MLFSSHALERNHGFDAMDARQIYKLDKLAEIDAHMMPFMTAKLGDLRQVVSGFMRDVTSFDEGLMRLRDMQSRQEEVSIDSMAAAPCDCQYPQPHQWLSVENSQTSAICKHFAAQVLPLLMAVCCCTSTQHIWFLILSKTVLKRK